MRDTGNQVRTPTPGTRPDSGRRLALKGLAAAPLCIALLPAAAAARAAEPRVLAFHHLHTGEQLSLTYFADGAYLPEALARIDWLLRDFRNDEAHAIDPRLLDILHALRRTCKQTPFEIISGYRSATTNAMLHKADSSGVAARSLHLQGRAIDVRLAGFDTARLRAAAIALGRGGVGFYPESDFVHLDTGRVRAWGPASS